MADMGLLYTSFEIAHLERRGDLRIVPDALVDTGSAYTWIPRPLLKSLGVAAERKQGFVVADGRSLERDTGYALVRAAGAEAPDLVVFAEAGDMVLLGSHSLEGLNLKIDPVRKALVPAGPVIAARRVSSPYSCRSATVGSTESARRVGTMHASRHTASITPA